MERLVGAGLHPRSIDVKIIKAIIYNLKSHAGLNAFPREPKERRILESVTDQVLPEEAGSYFERRGASAADGDFGRTEGAAGVGPMTKDD